MKKKIVFDSIGILKVIVQSSLFSRRHLHTPYTMSNLAAQNIWSGSDHAVEKREQALENIKKTRKMIGLISGSSIPMTRKSLEEIRQRLWRNYDELMRLRVSDLDIIELVLYRNEQHALFTEGISLLKRLYQEKNHLRTSLRAHQDEYTLWDKALFKAQCGVNENFLLM